MEEFRGKKIIAKKFPIFVIFGLVLFFAFSYFFAGNFARAASAPLIITYQGKLLVSSYLATTTQNMYFVLYDSLSGGTALYSASGTTGTPNFINVTPSQGLFSVNLGDTGTNAVTSTIFRDNASVFLEVRIGSDTLTPRKRITSVPYAFNSRFLDGVPGDTLSTTTYIPISDSIGAFRFNSTTITTATIGRATITTSTISALTVTSTLYNTNGQTFFGPTLFPGVFGTTLDVGRSISTNGAASQYTSLATINLTSQPAAGTSFAASYGYGQVPSSNSFDMTNSATGTSIIGTQGEVSFAGTGGIHKAVGLYGLASNDGSGVIEQASGLESSAILRGSGNIASMFGLRVINSLTGTGSATTSYGIHISNPSDTGAGSIISNYGIYLADMTAGTTDYSIYSDGGQSYHAGNFGIGDTSPSSTLTVGNGDLFQVDFNGNIIKIRNVTYSWPSGQGASSTILQNNGSGVLAWVATSTLGISGYSSWTLATTSADTGYSVTSGVAAIFTGINGISTTRANNILSIGLVATGATADTYGSASTTPTLTVDAYGRITAVSTSSISLNANQIAFGTLAIARGGTNSSTIGPAGSVAFSNGSAYTFTATGTAGQLLQANGTSAPSWISTSSLGINTSQWTTSGANIYYVGGVGINTTSVSSTLFVQGTGTTTPFNIVSTTGKSLLRVLQNGNIGVGTSTPAEKLSVVGNISNLTTSDTAAAQISTVAIGASPRGVFVSGRYAYTADYNSSTISVIDISNPSAPVRIATTSVGTNPFGIYVSGRYAYTANFGSSDISVIDISNPSAPIQVGTATVGGGPASIYVSGRYAYTANFTGSNISIVDISNPAAPTQVSTVSTGGGSTPQSIYVSGRYAYTANFSGNSMSVIDISNPSAPVHMGSTTVGGQPHGIYVSGRYAYVANVASNTLAVVDIYNPASPVRISTATVGAGPRSVYVAGRYAYVANANDANISIVDISNSSTPMQITTASAGNGPYAVYVSGRYAFTVNLTDNTMSLIDISGTEVSSLIAHSAEAGNIQSRNDIFAQGNVVAGTSLLVGAGGMLSNGPVAVFASSTLATSSIFSLGSAQRQNIFTVFADGNIGVGTSTPEAKLHIVTTTEQLRLGYDGANYASFTVGSNGTLTIDAAGSVTTSISDKLSVLSNSYFGTIASGTWNGSLIGIAYGGTNSSTIGPAGSVAFSNGSAYTFTATGTAGQLLQANGASAPSWISTSSLGISGSQWTTSGANIYYVGGVGINTTSVSATLFVAGSGGTTPFTITSSTGSTMLTMIQNGNVGIGTSTPLAKLGVVGTAGNNDLLDIASSTGGSLLRVRANGNVGIGTSTPAEKLSVSGNISNLVDANTVASQLSTVTVGTNPYAIFASGRYVYTANWGANTMSVIDVANPAAPIHLASTTVGGSPRGIYVSGRYAYVANSGSHTISVVDISKPSAPVQVATTTVGSGPRAVYVSGKYAYTANYNSDSISVVDISNPLAPTTVVATTSVGDAPMSVFVSGHYAYTANSDANNISVVDISNPAAPVQIATTSVGTGPQSIYVSGRYAYTANYGGSTISVINIANPAAPALVVTASVAGNPFFIFASGRYAYTANAGGNTISVIDVQNSSTPMRIINAAVGSGPQALYVSGRYAYVANSGASTVSVVDISGTEVSSLIAHSAEVGNIQSRNDIFAQGNIIAGTSMLVGAGGIMSNGVVSIFASSTAASSSIFGIDSVQTSNIFKVFASGRVSIGTSTASSTLMVQGSGGTNPLSVVSSTGDSMLTVLQNGAVGISSSSPVALLSIAGTAGKGIIKVVSTSGQTLMDLDEKGDWVFRSSDGSSVIQMSASGGMVLTPLAGKLFVAGTSPYLRAWASGQNIGIRGNFSTTGVGANVFINSEDPRQNTSGTSTQIQVQGLFWPTSGNGDFIGLDVGPVVSTSITYDGGQVTALRVSPRMVSTSGTTKTLLVDVGTNSAASAGFGANGAHTSLFVVDSLGKVGIGSSTPLAMLTVVDGAILAVSSTNATGTPMSGPGTRLMWVPNKAAFRAGTVGVDEWDDGKIGTYSAAFGVSTIASGVMSFAFGNTGVATGNASFAGGLNATSSHNRTFAFGQTVEANNQNAIALGKNVLASGTSSVAIGDAVTSTGDTSFALGEAITVTGNNSFGIGLGAISTLAASNTFAVTGDVLINTTTKFGANNYALYVDSGSGSGGYGIGVEGRVQASGIITSGTLDIAESYFIEPSCLAGGTCPEPGDVVCAAPGLDATVRKCSAYGDEKTLGVISTNPGLFLGNAPEENPFTRMVALAGRVPVKVSTANGSIAVGDKLAPSGLPGIAVKAVSEGPTVGIAIADYAGAEIGQVLTFVNLGWKNTLYRGLSVSVSSGTISVGSLASPYDLALSKNLIFNNTEAVNKISFATSTLFESNLSPFAGARAFTFNAGGFTSPNADNYIISVRANNNPVFSVAANGDVRAAGNYFGASAILGTSTNPGDLAERVDIATDDTVEAGDVMVVDKNAPDTYRRSTLAHEQSVAGVISTNPTIVVGNGKTDYTAVLAMVGRVPIKVSNENGNIQRGDLLITASATGYAMKYDPTKDNSSKMVAVIGVALEPLSSSTGKILSLIRTGWIYNRDLAINNIENNITQLAAAQGLNLNPASLPENLNIASNGGQLVYAGGNLDLQNNLVINVAGIAGKDNKWRIDEWGNIIQKIATAKGDKEIYGLQSTGRQEVVISGTSTLADGYKKVLLTELDQEIVDKNVPLKVSITMSGETKGVYVSEKNYDSFAVKENENGQSNAAFDWIVIAKILPADAPLVVAPAEETTVSAPLVPEILDNIPPVTETLSTTPEAPADSVTTTEVSSSEVSSSSVALP